VALPAAVALGVLAVEGGPEDQTPVGDLDRLDQGQTREGQVAAVEEVGREVVAVVAAALVVQMDRTVDRQEDHSFLVVPVGGVGVGPALEEGLDQGVGHVPLEVHTHQTGLREEGPQEDHLAGAGGLQSPEVGDLADLDHTLEEGAHGTQAGEARGGQGGLLGVHQTLAAGGVGGRQTPVEGGLREGQGGHEAGLGEDHPFALQVEAWSWGREAAGQTELHLYSNSAQSHTCIEQGCCRSQR